MNNATMSALCFLSAWQNGIPINGGLAYAEMLKKYNLDYSVDSLDRIDNFLDQLRPIHQADPKSFFDSTANFNLLYLLAFYTGELIGRTHQCAPQWLTYEEAIAMEPGNRIFSDDFASNYFCHFPGKHPHIGAFRPLAALFDRLFAEFSTKSIRSSSRLFMNIKYDRDPYSAIPIQPIPPQNLPITRPDDLTKGIVTTEEKNRTFMHRPDWLIANPKDKLSYLFDNQATLLREGRIVWGAMVQVNKRLFQPEYFFGAPGSVIYDAEGRVPAEVLSQIAPKIFSLKGKTHADESVQEFSDHITNEMDRHFGVTVPSSLLPYPLKMSVTYFDQLHLPDGMLSLRYFPLLVSEVCPGAVMPLPCKFWPAEFYEEWLQTCEKRLGRRYDVQQLRHLFFTPEATIQTEHQENEQNQHKGWFKRLWQKYLH